MRRLAYILVALLAAISPAFAQSKGVGGYAQGQVLTAGELDTSFQGKADYPGIFLNFGVSGSTIWQRPSSASQNAIPFGTIVNEGFFSGTGVGGASYWDTVVSAGWNISQTIEAPAVPGVAANYDTWESKFHQPGAGDYQIERHFGLIDTNSVIHRYMSFALPWDGRGAVAGSGSSPAIGTLQLDSLNFNNWAGTQTLVMNLTGNVLNINNGFLFFVSNNNVSTFRQSNAAGNAFLQLPYINASDQLQLSQSAIGPSHIATAAAPTVSAGQIGYGSTTVAAGAGTCPTGTVGGQTVQGCVVVNIAGTSRNVPFF
jgi:hypothetical protein